MKKVLFYCALTILIAFIFIGIFADFIAPMDPDAINMANSLASPSAEHLLGTDHLGRDLLSRLIYGSRSSVFIAFFATGCTLLLGLTIGLVSGYFGGWADQLIQGIVNIFQGIPSTAFVVAVLGLLGPGIKSLLIAIVVSSWARFSRVVRNQVLEIREMHYIEGARAMGGSNLYIIRRHVLPNILLPLLVLIATRIGSTVLTVAAMSFLGLGLRAPASDWGIMINDAKLYFVNDFRVLLAPAACLTMFCLSINLIADYLRDHLDNDADAAQIL
ncbi:MAG: ABC transporter permease [Saccharofermentanales bacterium]|jgi:peptide/nickel transport system permease protein